MAAPPPFRRSIHTLRGLWGSTYGPSWRVRMVAPHCGTPLTSFVAPYHRELYSGCVRMRAPARTPAQFGTPLTLTVTVLHRKFSASVRICSEHPGPHCPAVRCI